MSALPPRWLTLGAVALIAAGVVAWALRGPALLLDLTWMGCL